MRAWWHGVGALGAALAVVVGCRDLELPASGLDTNPGPTLRFVSPTAPNEGDAPEVSLVSFVSVEAQDADGVGAVELSCDAQGAEVGLVRWVSPPYESPVDLSPCRGSGLDGDAELTLLLTARATDALGNRSAQDQSVRVRVNLTVASIAIHAPQRVSPGDSFDLSVTSDLPLLGVPAVKVEGTPAQYTGTIDSTDGGLPEYQFHATAPPLGGEGYPGTASPPLEVLEQLERFTAIVAEGRATNGNVTQVQAQIRISRVLWERTLPGTFFIDVTDGPIAPVAVDGGVYVPLEVPTRAVSWDLIRFQNDNGQPTYLPPDLLNSVYEARQGVATGEALLISDGGVDVELLPDGGLGHSDAGFHALRTLTRVTDPSTGNYSRQTLAFLGNRGSIFPAGTFACEENVSGCVAGQRAVSCVGAAGDVIIDGGVEGFQTRPLVVSSGDVLAVVNAGTSCSTGLADARRVAPLQPGLTGFVSWPGLGAPLTRLLPEGNGAFFAAYLDAVASAYRVVEFDLQSGSRFTPAALPVLPGGLVAPSLLLAARPDHTVVVFRTFGLVTTFALWQPLNGKIAAETDLPFVYGLPYAVGPVLPAAAEADTDGTVYALLRRLGTTPGRPRLDIVALGPTLRPRWIYHYPRADEGTDGAYRLTFDRVTGQLYLVDGDNGFVVALAR